MMEDRNGASVKFAPESEKDAPPNSGSKGKQSLFQIMVKTYGWELLHSHIFKAFYDVLVFTTPVLLR